MSSKVFDGIMKPKRPGHDCKMYVNAFTDDAIVSGLTSSTEMIGEMILDKVCFGMNESNKNSYQRYCKFKNLI